MLESIAAALYGPEIGVCKQAHEGVVAPIGATLNTTTAVSSHLCSSAVHPPLSVHNEDCSSLCVSSHLARRSATSALLHLYPLRYNRPSWPIQLLVVACSLKPEVEFSLGLSRGAMFPHNHRLVSLPQSGAMNPMGAIAPMGDIARMAAKIGTRTNAPKTSWSKRC